MSLIKQLWVAIAVVVVLMFVSSFGISFMAAKEYFEEQLRLKNIDNSTSLALALGQIEKDPALVETFVSAQFDMGHYLRIRLDDPSGQLLVQRESEVAVDEVVPAWFVRLFALEVAPGLALVSDGWSTYGQLLVESHHSYAYQALWRSAWRLLGWTLLLALVCGVLGSILLKRIIRPLYTVILQAEAIGEQRFVTADEPRTREFGQLVRAMNGLSARVRQILEEEGSRLERLRFTLEHDPLTGLLNRDSFLGQMDALLAEPDTHSRHGLFIVRLQGLAELDLQLGHAACDEHLRNLASALVAVQAGCDQMCRNAVLGRLRAADFGLLVADAVDLEELAAVLQKGLHQLVTQGSLPAQAGCAFRSGNERADVLLRADNLLARAEGPLGNGVEMQFDDSPRDLPFMTAEQWRAGLQAGLAGGISAELFPVVSTRGELLHEEAMMRMNLAGSVRTAGVFVPWARRLGLQATLDMALLEHLLEQLAREPVGRQVAINLSPEIMRDAVLLARLEQLLRDHPQQAGLLWLECNEAAALQDPDSFELFARRLRKAGCKVGVDRAVGDVLRSPRAHELGLSYLKVDAVYAQRLAGNGDIENFLQRLGALARSLGIRVVLEGVASENLLAIASQCGIDGITGPAVRLR
jgi:EAL domain-containing protein (putative c-di-GMP-specific phosphodiesterase class I)/GGDEF domain-containing protein